MLTICWESQLLLEVFKLLIISETFIFVSTTSFEPVSVLYQVGLLIRALEGTNPLELYQY